MGVKRSNINNKKKQKENTWVMKRVSFYKFRTYWFVLESIKLDAIENEAEVSTLSFYTEDIYLRSKATKIDRKGVFSSVYMDKFLKIKTTIENCADTQVIRHNSNSWIVDRPHPGAM